jgi:hypothetical protein
LSGNLINLNAGFPFDLLATRLAAYSTYAEAAQRSSPPISRLADRFALASLATTLALSLGASVFSGDPIRAVASRRPAP